MVQFDKAIIVLPTYNEADNIERMLQTLHKTQPQVHLLVVDDNSPDKTAELVEKLIAQTQWPELHLLKRAGKAGLGTAYMAGFNWAMEKGFQYFMTMDSDFSHPPEEVPAMIAKAEKFDLVIGSRYIGGIRIINWPFRRLLLSSFASRYVRLILGVPFFDPTSGFNCFTRKAVEKLKFDKILTRGYAWQVELKFKVWSEGLACVEHPIIFTERRDGQSKMSKAVIFESAISVFKLRLQKILGLLNR